jgi:hypothetical protein
MIKGIYFPQITQIAQIKQQISFLIKDFICVIGEICG